MPTPNRLPAPMIVLRSLLAGHTVELGARKYKLFCETDSIPLSDGFGGLENGKYWLGAEAMMRGSDGSNPRTIYLGHDMPLADFIELCNGVSEDDLFLLSANSALQSMNKDRRKKNGTI
jgi:hypothetical protein